MSADDSLPDDVATLKAMVIATQIACLEAQAKARNIPVVVDPKYKNFFAFQNMSYGATLAWLLFGVTLAITLAIFWVGRRVVYYAGER